jgi:hypothetical protein
MKRKLMRCRVCGRFVWRRKELHKRTVPGHLNLRTQGRCKGGGKV